MRALTLTQPFATLIAVGGKKIETRSWSTNYRGPLAIHASKGYGKGGMRAHTALCGTEPFCTVLNAASERHYGPWSGLREIVEHPFMPLGAIVATCELVGIVPTEYIKARKIIRLTGYDDWLWTEQENAFGDYTPGRYAWLLSNVRALETPMPARGAQGLWNWEARP